jgi:hypothetical protein
MPGPADMATFSGLQASTCAEEGTLRSGTGPATRVQFTNNATGRITIYWLNAQGRRVEYRKLAAGQSYEQPTFVTHPWLIANEQDQCLGIYTPVQAGTASLTINQTVTTGTAAPTGPLAPASEASITEARAREGGACLKAKGDSTTATAIEGLINLYVQMRTVVGEDIAKRAYLAPAAKALADKGC